jgi:hypothetical protein
LTTPPQSATETPVLFTPRFLGQFHYQVQVIDLASGERWAIANSLRAMWEVDSGPAALVMTRARQPLLHAWPVHDVQDWIQ